MKLIIAIAHDKDRNRVMDALTQNGFAFTKLGSTGGFLREGNVTLLIGVEDEETAKALEVLRAACSVSERYVNASAAGPLAAIPPQPVRVEAGGVVAFVVKVESFERY